MVKHRKPFLSVPDGPRDWRSVISWWERRRFVYSLLVLALVVLGEAGKVLLYPGYIRRTGTQEEWGLVTLFVGIHIVYTLAVSNLCYTGGWISELLARALLKDKVRNYAPVAYAAGVTISTLALLISYALIALHMAKATTPDIG